jgi:Carboxypeptidase regulatory-like domain/TonB dependent receptor
VKHIAAPRFILGALCLLLLCAGTASAQLFPGRITGAVRDAQGAAVVGATVKLTNPSTGLERTDTSDQNGEFNFPQLALGTYTLTITKDGFNTTIMKDIATSEVQVNTITPVLTVGTVTSEIQVTTTTPLIQTETNYSGGQLDQNQVESLPIGNSDYTRLALVLPGVTQNSNFAFAQYTINGSRSRSNGFNIDGASDTDPSTYLPSINEGGNSATAATRLPLDAIQEVSIIAAGGADSGQNSGSVMNVIIRSGTNQFHGSLYELHRDAALDAANFFENLNAELNGVPTSKAPFVWNEFGGTAGGPVYIPHVYDGRNRTFFFVGYDGSRLRLGTTLHGTAPTPGQIQQATTLVQGAGIPPNQLGLNIVGLYSSLGLSGPFAADNRGMQTPNSYVFKFDHKISDSDSLSTRFLHGTGEDEFPGGGPGPGGGSQLNPWFGVTPTVADNFAISEVHIFTPNLINTLRLGWNRFSQFQRGRDSNVDPSTLGFNTGVAPNCFGTPELDIGDTVEGGFSNLGLQNCAGGRVATSYQISDDFNWTHGAHALKFGFNFLHDYSDYTITGSRGIFTFNGTQLGNTLTQNVLGAQCNVTPSPCPPLAVLVDLIAGLPSPGPGVTSINRVGSGRANINQNIVSGFAMDTYKLTQRLTLIAGLRYDFFTTVNESRDRFSAFDPTLGLVPAAQLPGGTIYNAPKHDFGPRVSFAYNPPFTVIPGRQTIFRAGFGIYYDTIPLNNFQEGLAQNPVGPTGGFQVVPSAPIPFGVGVPIFGTGAPQPPFNIESIQHNLKTPNTMLWNFNVQQELASKIVLQVGYVGNKSIHQLQLLDINQPPVGAGFGPGCNPVLPPNQASGDPVCEQNARPFNARFPNLSQINTISSNGFATYHSLQAVLRANDFHGFTTQVSFTWSHNLDTASEVEDFFGTSGYVPQNALDIHSGYGNSEFDQRRALIWTYIYAIPSPKIDNKFGYVLRDWQISGTTTLRDGLAAPILTFGDESGVGNFHTYFNCVAPIHYQLHDFTMPYASASSFAEPAPGTFGNCPRDPLVAPGLTAWDISIQRTFKFGERFGFQFRTSFFNAFNHPNFAEPAPDLGTQITASADDGSFDSHFGVGGPRNIQFMGKLTF